MTMSGVRPSRIQVLPSALVDQIAAGEVVERPASVVKELCENALDAGARRIDVDLDRGGLERIRVQDDGSGMSAEEAHLALRRHATSKLRSIDDLVSIGTMGFRGEALPSIASVSKLTLTTREPTSDAAVRIEVAGGEVQNEGPAGAPPGTTIEVRDLFWNVPARLKFMKAEATELTHCIDAVTRLALANPGVQFRVRSGSRVVLDLPAHATVIERCRAALAKNARSADALVTGSGGEQAVRVDAYLGAPDDATHTTRGTYLFVNRRFVRDRNLLHALAMGYGELLDKGRYPLAVVFLNVDGRELDVNVHPQKLEVRFSRPQIVQAALRHVVAEAIAGAAFAKGQPVSPVRVYSLPPAPQAGAATGYDQQRRRAAEALKLFAPPPRALTSYGPQALTRGVGMAPPSSAAPPPKPAFVEALEAGLSVDAAKQAARRVDPAERAASEPGFFASLTYLGQLDRTYLLCASAGELVLIDQHSAHERVTFQRLRETYAQRRMAAQRLLIPVTVEVTEVQAETCARDRELLAQLGFELERRGPTTIEVRALPQELARSSPEQLAAEVLHHLVAGGKKSLAERSDEMLATLACHSVVRAGDVLEPTEVRALLDSMEGIDYRSHQPHGRPVLLRISLSEIERRFGRT